MALIKGDIILVCAFALVWVALATSDPEPWTVTEYTEAKVSFYGGQAVGGTMGGSCGYGDVYRLRYGISAASLSPGLFNNGLSCGACFEIRCNADEDSSCYQGQSVIITATDVCPAGTYGGYCDSLTAGHFELSAPLYRRIAAPNGEIIPAQYKRVPCVRAGGVRFTINGNPNNNNVLVHNVAGGGDVAALAMKATHTGWTNLNHSWGQMWTGAQVVYGQTLSFRVTLGDGEARNFMEIVPNNWQFGQTFEANSNF